MQLRAFKLGLRLLLAVNISFLQGCGFMRRPVNLDSIPESRSARLSTATMQNRTVTISTSIPAGVANPTFLPTETAYAVIIEAVHGNLFIRRGPHPAFNPIGVLYEGESATAIGRDALSRWILISIPSASGKTGWISIQTRFSTIQGDTDRLPVIDTVDWPEGAYLINCTHHQMLAQPGEYIIPSSYEFPDNEVSVFPGIYTIYDLDAVGEPEIMKNVELREGVEIMIREDAAGERRKCP